MRSVGIRELRERTSEIMSWVRDDGLEVQITHYGRPVARLVPIIPAQADEETSPNATSNSTPSVWTELDQLAAEIGARWPDGISAVETVVEGRREL